MVPAVVGDGNLVALRQLGTDHAQRRLHRQRIDAGLDLDIRDAAGLHLADGDERPELAVGELHDLLLRVASLAMADDEVAAGAELELMVAGKDEMSLRHLIFLRLRMRLAHHDARPVRIGLAFDRRHGLRVARSHHRDRALDFGDPEERIEKGRERIASTRGEKKCGYCCQTKPRDHTVVFSESKMLAPPGFSPVRKDGFALTRDNIRRKPRRCQTETYRFLPRM